MTGGLWRSKILPGLMLVALAVIPARLAEAERPPFFMGTVIFNGGETRLDLADDEATRIPLPSAFDGWGCYIGDTRRVGVAFVKQVTCGGPWGFVDAFASCDSRHRTGTASLRLRQAVNGTKEEADAAERVTIAAVCGYDRKK